MDFCLCLIFQNSEDRYGKPKTQMTKIQTVLVLEF